MEWSRQTQLIPDGVQTMSKMPKRYVEGVYPIYADRAEGAYLYSDGKKYIDYPLGLGPILLGHGDRRIVNAIGKQMADGWVYSLPHRKEGELAEKLCDMVPSFEMCRFLKSGTEATTAAVKIARAYTNQKVVLSCGYHGWNDWYAASTMHPGGCPPSRSQEIRKFKYNDIESLKALIKRNVAAVIMEPYILEGPKEGFLRKVRKICTENNIVLIFDEVITGFRTIKYTAQAMYDVTPDLTALGKAMGNGMPISAVGGKKELMELLEKDVFVSSTFGGEALSIAAALETLRIVQNEGTIEHIWSYGEQMKGAFNSYAEGLDGVECIGHPCRTFFNFPTDEHRCLFWQECLERGVLFGYSQFVSEAHGHAELDKTYDAMRAAMSALRKNWDEPSKRLRGSVPVDTLRLRD